jgi:hypothetical protein
VEAALATYLQLGGRRIDSSDSYHSQKFAGAALAASGLARGDVFFTSKVGPYLALGGAEARAQFSGSLAVALAMPPLFWVRGFSAWVLLPLLLTPMAWRQMCRLKDSKSPAELIALLGDTGKLLAAYAALLAVGLWR